MLTITLRSIWLKPWTANNSSHLATLESLGSAIFHRVFFNFHDLKDSIYRSPWHKFKLRPEYTQSEDQPDNLNIRETKG